MHEGRAGAQAAGPVGIAEEMLGALVATPLAALARAPRVSAHGGASRPTWRCSSHGLIFSVAPGPASPDGVIAVVQANERRPTPGISPSPTSKLLTIM
jgi:hypothetical protein